MKLFTPDYEPVDLDELGAPNPTAFFAPDTGVASLMNRHNSASASPGSCGAICSMMALRWV